MIQAVGAINQYEDPEYLRIILELRRLGLSPSGNKSVDKSRLNQAKKKAEERFEIKVENNEITTDRADLEEKRSGAVALGELNKLYFGL